MNTNRCGDADAHRFHQHEAEIEVSCTGMTRCGVQDHPGHDFVEVQRLWCPGICDCGMGGTHGPGNHK